MGYGGYINLINGSPYDWVASGSHSYQMPAWDFPTVSAGASQNIYVEWQYPEGTIADDAGEVFYTLSGTSNTFQVWARNPNAFHLYVYLDNLDTETNKQGDQIDLNFRHDGGVNWIMSEDDLGRLWTNVNPPVDWMHQSLPTLGNRKLKHICMPGSHDAGMSELNRHTVGSTYSNTQTQLMDIYNQLIYGSRWFDIRPVISNGEFVAGHYGSFEHLWFGGNGQPLADIIKNVNQFTESFNELIILYISHTMDTDNRYTRLSQDQWSSLFEQLKGINHRFMPSNFIWSLADLKLSDLLSENAPTVLVVIELDRGAFLGDYRNQGLHNAAFFDHYDRYSDTDRVDHMESDQLSKLASERNIVANPWYRRDRFHVFSWTLTQTNPFGAAIVNMAASVHDDLFNVAYPRFTPWSFPNVLYMDAYACRDKAVINPAKPRPDLVPAYPDVYALAMAINFGLASKNDFITGQRTSKIGSSDTNVVLQEGQGWLSWVSNSLFRRR